MSIRTLVTTMQAGVFLGFCAACATTNPLVIDFSETTTPRPLDRIKGCAVKIVSVIDERKSKEDVGIFQGQVVEGRQVMPWLQQAMASLNSPDREMVGRNNDRPMPRNMTVHVGLTKFYIHHPLQNSFAATILLQATYQVDQEASRSHQYRGADTKVNWIGSAGSVRTLFNDVLDDVVRRMHADIQQHCQSGVEKSGT